jgi:hypothetical protein
MLPAPLVFVAHVLEEGPGFVDWINAHVARDITAGLFWTANGTALLITVLVALGVRSTRSEGAVMLAVAWLGFLMAANAALHVTAAIVDRAYVPGVLTASLLYLPYSAWVASRAIRSGRIAPAPLAAAALLGAIPMVVHGYRILFLGDRLF